MTKKSFRLVTGVVLLLTPLLFSLFFTLLQLTFGYPAILSAPTDEILRRFAQGGSLLIATWSLADPVSGPVASPACPG